MHRVLVAGCGNFGSWWVVGLLRDQSIDCIHIYDPFHNPVSVIESRATSSLLPSSNLVNSRIRYFNDLQLLDDSYTLIILSCNSSSRLRLFQEILRITDSHYWVLEKVLTSSLDELSVFKKLCKGRNVYVNHSRRFQPLWLEVSRQLNSLGLINFIYQDLGPWELASNSFHFIDVISWLFGVNLISASVISGTWRDSEVRSSGYYDLDGSLMLTYENNISHIINRNKSYDTNIYKFCMNKSNSSCQKLLVDELVGFKNLLTGHTHNLTMDDWSSMVPLFTTSLFFSGISLLPSFDSIASNTEIALQSFRRSWIEQFGSEEGFKLS